MIVTFASTKKRHDKILVTEATGILGSAVIETLLKKIPSNQISIITRKEGKRTEFDSKGFNTFLGDYATISSLEQVMLGVDAVLLISSGDQEDRMQEDRNGKEVTLKRLVIQ
ncbi:MAG: NAD(P)H-binding protein [Chryseolinea sp.]